jgi:hypothetical protein
MYEACIVGAVCAGVLLGVGLTIVFWPPSRGTPTTASQSKAITSGDFLDMPLCELSPHEDHQHTFGRWSNVGGSEPIPIDWECSSPSRGLRMMLVRTCQNCSFVQYRRQAYLFQDTP